MFKKDELPIVGILRGIKPEYVTPLTETCIRAGLRYVEITMNSGNAVKLIQDMIRIAGDQLVIGAGTVLGIEDMNNAINAGACFIVTPVVIPEVITSCKKLNIPVFPGAFTPTEVFSAWSLGATMVKVFPASVLGISYIKQIKAPLDKVKIMATGGINAQNISGFFANGSDAVAFGGSIFSLEWMFANRYDLIEEKIKELLSAV